MTLIEMEGFLHGKCLPGDMLVNETNAQYLHRKLTAYEATAANLAAQVQVQGLAAENAALKASKPSFKSMMAALDAYYADEEVPESAMLIAFNILRGSIETPTTDAALAEIRAQGVELFAKTMHADSTESEALDFAQQLRKEQGK